MGFSDFWTDDEAPTPDGGSPFPADGRHSGTIKVAEIKELDFKRTEKNKSGKCLVVKVAVKGCRWVESIIPVNFRGLIQEVLRAARVADNADPEDLIDAEVQIETTLAVSNKGREFCRVKFLEGPPGVAPKPKPAPKPVVKVADADDSIPF